MSNCTRSALVHCIQFYLLIVAVATELCVQLVNVKYMFLTLSIVYTDYIRRRNLPQTKEEIHVFARVCLFVCLSVSKINQKRVHGFG